MLNLYREFHISGDLLVVYRVKDETLQLIRIGSHSEIFRFYGGRGNREPIVPQPVAQNVKILKREEKDAKYRTK